jgi:Salmonella virulence plasmid 65kDa B protein
MAPNQAISDPNASAANQSSAPPPPAISLPKGGGAIRGIGEKFSVNPVTGTGSLSVPIFTSPGRSDFSPKLSLSYDSGSGNGPFALGWHLSITRETGKGLPRYDDASELDVKVRTEMSSFLHKLLHNNAQLMNSCPLPNCFSMRVAGFIEFKSRHRLTGGNLPDGSFFRKTQIQMITLIAGFRL